MTTHVANATETPPRGQRSIASGALSGGVAVVPLFVLDAFVTGGVRTVSAAALGFLSGAFVGVALASTRKVIGALPLRTTRVAWPSIGAALGVLTAASVGAFHKLGGSHGGMAAFALTCGCAFGALFGVGVGVVERARTEGTARRAWLLFAASQCLATTLVLLEPTLWVLRGYPSLRTAMALGALAAAAEGVDAIMGRVARVPARVGLGILSIGIAGSVAIVARLEPEDLSALLTASEARRTIVFLRDVTDFDRDGASSFFGGGDCAPFDPRVGPFAREIPGNGVDDNCRYGDAPAYAGEGRATAPPPTDASPVNVVLVTIDALRPDRTTPYGFSRGTTPNLARFAKTATRFDAAYTSGGWTALALPSLIYGVYPRSMSWSRAAVTKHGALVPFPWSGHIPDGDEFVAAKTVLAREPHPDLAAWLHRRGMRTAAVVPKGFYGLDGLFEHDFDSFRHASVMHDDGVADAAIAALGVAPAKPFFLWVHFYDPHEPPGEDPGIPDLGNTVEDRYDRDVAYSDAQFGRFLDALDRLPSPPAVIVASDHGEALTQGLQFHGVDLFEDSIRIVMMARGPGLVAGASSRDPVSLVDIMPTILAWTHTPGPAALDGVDLRHHFANRLVITDLWRHEFDGARFLDEVVITGGAIRLDYDALLSLESLTATGDLTRPPRRLTATVPDVFADALGAHLERARALP